MLNVRLPKGTRLGLTSRETTAGELFAPGQALTMPPYQRSYSWGEKEALDLLGDLRDAAASEEIHFIGAIVVVKDEESDSYEIVDGQQRLTTLTILLAVLRDLETDAEAAATIHSLIGDTGRPMLSEEARWRLTLNHIDGPFFRAMVQEQGSTALSADEGGESESQRRMTRNAGAFRRALSNIDIEERRALTDTIINGCAIVRVTVADRDAGYKVFRVLNDRGKEPNAHDIIKTEIFERAGFSVDEADKQSRRWAEHEALLGGSAFDDLLRQIRFTFDKSNKGDLVSGFRKAPLGKIPPMKFLSETLPKYVEAYDKVARADLGNSPDSEQIRDRLYQLHYLDHQTWKAPAIHYLATRGEQSKDALDFFKGLERLGYLLQLVIPNRDQRNRRYRRVIESIDARGRDNFYGRGGALAVSRDDGRKVHERLRGRFATFTQRRAMILRLNAAMEGGQTVPPGADATVEHVLPRNPSKHSHWFKVWPDEKSRRELCDTIGNLVLLPRSINEQADTLTYQDKKKLYFSDSDLAHFALTQAIEDEHTWTPEVVSRRSTQLADILCKDWGYTI
ncbi:MAG: DUF262 domain-containing HNH endonuclease family protein [Pseudomonadota bacterium]